jgi:hypothetical protein
MMEPGMASFVATWIKRRRQSRVGSLQLMLSLLVVLAATAVQTSSRFMNGKFVLVDIQEKTGMEEELKEILRGFVRNENVPYSKPPWTHPIPYWMAICLKAVLAESPKLLSHDWAPLHQEKFPFFSSGP